MYAHRLASREDVVEWVKGTHLDRLRYKRMTPTSYAAFLARYREALFEKLADVRPFLYGFKRMLIWGAGS